VSYYEYKNLLKRDALYAKHMYGAVEKAGYKILHLYHEDDFHKYYSWIIENCHL